MMNSLSIPVDSIRDLRDGLKDLLDSEGAEHLVEDVDTLIDEITERRPTVEFTNPDNRVSISVDSEGFKVLLDGELVLEYVGNAATALPKLHVLQLCDEADGRTSVYIQFGNTLTTLASTDNVCRLVNR